MTVYLEAIALQSFISMTLALLLSKGGRTVKKMQGKPEKNVKPPAERGHFTAICF